MLSAFVGFEVEVVVGSSSTKEVGLLDHQLAKMSRAHSPPKGRTWFQASFAAEEHLSECRANFLLRPPGA